MDIHNKTCVPTNILVPLIDEAVFITECRNTDFTMKFTSGKYLRGIAYSRDCFCSIILPISTKNGISLWWKEDYELPIEIYKTIVHECNHVSDYQNRRDVRRSCEIRAQKNEQKALQIMSSNLLDGLTDWIHDKRRNPTHR